MDPERMVRLGFPMVAADPSRIPEDVVDKHIEVLAEHEKDPGVAVAFLEAARSLMKLEADPVRFRSVMDAVSCPTLILHGYRDRFVPVGLAEAIGIAYPACRVRLLPRVGHAPMLEAPDRWVAAVQDWLGGPAGSP